jgi:nicotinamidase-related amidase
MDQRKPDRCYMAYDIGKLLEPNRVAVLLSEVQRSIIGDMARRSPLAQAATDVGVIGNSARLAEAARERGAPVVHCLANTAPGRFGANTNARLFAGATKNAQERPAHDPAGDAPCPEVWRDGDVVSMRDHGLNPMADSQLDHRLRNRGITTVVVTGVSLNLAILNLTMDAVNNSYQVVVARDAVAGFPTEYAGPVMQNTLAYICTLATTDEIIGAWRKS